MSRPTTPTPSSTAPPSSAPPAPQPSPFRSTTAPIKKHHHHHHIPHRHHHRDKSVPQSAILPSSNSSPFDSLLGPLTKVTSRTEGAPDLSSLIRDEREARARREAREREGQNDVQQTRETRLKLDKEATKRGWDEVEKRRAERKVGEEALSKSLQDLSTLATSTTRRLDYTYYSLLSHISALHSTLNSIASLSPTTSSLLSSFNAQTSELESDLSTQISLHTDNASTQSSRLEALEKRMQEGKKKVEGLGQRMENVRTRVREQERKEGEWSGRVRRRVRMCWGALATVLVLFVAGMMWQHWPRVEKGVDGAEEAVGRFANRSVEVLEDVRESVGETSDWRDGNETGKKVNVQVRDRTVDQDRVMRLLDEL